MHIIDCSLNKSSPRKELLHNIDPLCKSVGKRLYPDSFDNRVRAAIRVGDMKLLTGWPGKTLKLKLVKINREQLYLFLQ